MRMLGEDRVSPGLTNFINGLSAEEKECLVGVLREPKTFIAEDMMDVLAILRQLQSGEQTQNEV